jgi:AcrR family transcriptional regulator
MEQSAPSASVPVDADAVAAMHQTLAGIRAPTMSDNDIARLHPNKRVRAKAASRARLIDAARFLFANAGYFDTGIRDVAARMKMSTGAVFAQVESKAALWRLAMNGPAPDPALADEVALILAQRPRWGWLVRTCGGRGYTASLSSPDYCPAPMRAGHCWVRQGETPAQALREVRIAAERGEDDMKPAASVRQ